MEGISSDMGASNEEDTRGFTANFANEIRDTEKIKSIFEKGFSRSSTQSVFNGSDRISSLFKVFREATKMSKEFTITLPSDKKWRMKNYFKLLNMQKEKKIILHSMPSQESDVSSNWDPALLAQPELKKAKFSGTLSVSCEGSIPTAHSLDISWNSSDIAKAGMILEANSSSNITFQDEEEMRRVFTLIYDVFRYKHILSDALMETRFFQKYPEHSKSTSLVWLLFYDLHKRRFLPREHAEAIYCAEIFDQMGLTPIERDLWKTKVKLAASLARNRIKHNALRLNQLLPYHLRDERLVFGEDLPITGWINTFKQSKKEVCESIEKFGLKLQSKHETVLTKSDFRFDHLCPKLLLCHPVQRAELARSVLVKDYAIVLQDRAFCIGPAVIAKILSEIPLRGTVAQTHVNSPRTTAYLANILADNDRLDKMIAFGAGDKLLEYQTYLHDLSITNCEIYAQKFTEIHSEAAVFENLVAVFATPPNSCTGVTDPVDLICSRGGDMYMLKALTQSEVAENFFAFQEEQRETLQYCMSLPQVQIVLYETHSMANEENLDMVNEMIGKMNESAKQKHEEDHRIMLEQEEAEEKMNKPIGIPGSSREKEKEPQETHEAAQDIKVEIPPCDLFELVPLPDLCSHGSECLSEEGCFIARIQRKEIISLDAKYMIKIAEARGLFGNELGQKKGSTTRAQKKRDDPTNQRSGSGNVKSGKVKVEIERITAPTQSSMHRARKGESLMDGLTDCPRHHFHKLESINKVEIYSSRSSTYSVRRKSRSKKYQDESVRRLCKPNRRWSNPSSLLGEVRPSFWRYATAKSLEDLIRALRKKRRNKRSFRMDDFLMRHNQLVCKTNEKVMTDKGIPGLHITFFGKKYLYPFRKPYIHNKWSKPEAPINILDDYFDDVHLIYENEDRSMSIDSEFVKAAESETIKNNNIYASSEPSPECFRTLLGAENSELLEQCFTHTSNLLKSIDNAIEEKQLANKPRSLTDSKHETLQSKEQKKIKKILVEYERDKIFKYLQQITNMEEVNNIVNPIKNQDKKDIILHEKYLPGQQMSKEDRNFIKLLQAKLERLQDYFPGAHWTKKKEKELTTRLSIKKKLD